MGAYEEPTWSAGLAPSIIPIKERDVRMRTSLGVGTRDTQPTSDLLGREPELEPDAAHRSVVHRVHGQMAIRFPTNEGFIPARP